MATLSVVIIVLNAEATIKEALISAYFADEIIVVDSGSTDKTLSILKDFNVKIIHHLFSDIGKQKKFAINQASSEWILIMEADEVISHELAFFIKENIQKGICLINGYSLPVIDIFMETPLYFLDSEANQLRLFKNSAKNFIELGINEIAQTKGFVKKLDAPLILYRNLDISYFLEQFNQQTSLAAEGLFKKSVKENIFLSLVKFPIKFSTLYFVKGGFHFGAAGFVWSFLSSLHPVVKCIKLMEYHAKKIA